MGQFRRSIWVKNQAYKTEFHKIDSKLFQIIDIIQSVEAAKKQIPPIPLNNLIKMAELSKDLPNPSGITEEQFRKLLEDFHCYGSRPKTAIAIIAKLSGGEYPPIDEKTSKGLRDMKIITESDEKSLNGQSSRRITKIYVEKVLPAWRKERQSGKSPKQIDEEWARL